jgi:pseudaminic acid biosynthesis-associated methylase
LNTIELWKSSFGDEYTVRNGSATVAARQAAWDLVLPDDCESILEVGANAGLNLEALAELTEAELYATEPNDKARAELDLNGVVPYTHIRPDTADKLTFGTGSIDLVFTSGVLIHVPPDNLIASMREIHRVAKRYIICAEYFAPHEEMIPYRGYNDALWRRDYGSLYLDNFPDLRCIAHMFAWKRMTGLDNLTFWLFEKGRRRH